MSFVTSAFSAPVYNLPIFLFGMLAHESQEAVQSLQAVRTHILRRAINVDARPRLARPSRPPTVHVPSFWLHGLRHHLDA